MRLLSPTKLCGTFTILAAVTALAAGGEQIREISLPLPANIMELPKLQTRRHVVWQPTGWEDMTYCHSPMICWWQGRLFAAWHVAKRGEHSPRYVGLVSSSPDGVHWTVPVRYAEPGNGAYEAHVRTRFGFASDQPLTVNMAARALHATSARLYLWSLGWVTRSEDVTNSKRKYVGRVHWTEDGQTWHEIPPPELDRREQEARLLKTVRSAASNRSFVALSDGRIMAAAMGPGIHAPITRDRSGLSGWAGGGIDPGDAPRVWEPHGYEGSDGVLHFVSRHLGPHVWHAYSVDRGGTWTSLKKQRGFTDNPGNKQFGRLPDGAVWYLGNPLPHTTRTHLVLAISRDGWRFDRAYLVRWEPWAQRYPAAHKGATPGYEYPAGCCHDGKLYVAYAHARDYIELAIVKLSDLGVTKHGE